MHTLTFPVSLLRRYMHDMLRRPAGPMRCPVGISRRTGHCELLAAAPGSAVERVMLLSRTDTLTVPQVLPSGCCGVLLLGDGPQRGHARGVVCLPARAREPLHILRLVGSGMPTITLEQEDCREPPIRVDPGTDIEPTVRWSRTIAALGLDVWQRLVSLRYAIVGVGRTGSRLALDLARLGVQHLTLIDPDRVEPHNVGEMLGISATDHGRLKVEALAATLAIQASTYTDIVAVPTSITRRRALRAVQDCDVLVSCVDHNSARLAATALATLFCKPLLDVATGVHGHGASRQAGADVRFMLPGRYLWCFGGLRHAAEARQVLASPEAERTFATQRDWQRERAGSLGSLNQCAVGVALRLLEDLLAGRVQDSTWAHLEFDLAGRLSVWYPTVVPSDAHTPCRLCQLSGWGEEGVLKVVDLWRHDTFWHNGAA